MPYGEMLMELSDQQYNNPYKYNGKEFDAATGYYYYGARYYDPKRSFWLSVDPLADISGSPYAYVWNDPVNYADPSGMLGERVGGRPKDWYRDRLGNVSWHDSQEDEIKGKNGEKLTRLGKEGSYINIKGSTTQLNRNHTVTEDGKTSFVVRPSQMSASSMEGNDVPQIASPGKPKTYFSSFDTNKYYEPEPHEASGFHPTIMDPSASMMKGYIEAEAGGYLFRGFKGILFYDAGVQYTKVGHWCPRESYDIMSEAGYLVEEPGTAGHTFLSTAESGPTSWNDAPKGWVYSQFEVRTKDIMKAGTDEWFQEIHSTNPKNYLKTKILRQGGELTPRIRNLSPIIKTK